MVVLNLLEDGYLQKLKKKWWYDKGECPVEDGSVSRLFMLRLAYTLACTPAQTSIYGCIPT